MRALLALFGALVFGPGLACAQVAKILTVQGTVVVERAGQALRVLGVSDNVAEKDVISVAQKSYAMLEFTDRTRVTLRPNTIFRVDSYTHAAPEAMVLGVTKGGFRAVSGDIAKTGSTAMKIQTTTAILGVRGTEFDARLCASDCEAEERAKPPPRPVGEIAARVIDMTGIVSAVQPRGAPRMLTPGAIVYVEEDISTGPDAFVVLAFRDDARVTLAEHSRLSVPSFDFDSGSAAKGRARLKLVSGKAHVSTGQLAKVGPDAFIFETGVGLIRPYGTGFTAGAPASPSPEACVTVHTWDGAVVLQTPAEEIPVRNTETVAVSSAGGRAACTPLVSLMDSKAPRPDLVSIDPSTFAQPSSVEEGLYVWVRDGIVELDAGQDTLRVTAGNAAIVGRERVALLDAVPNFMRFDPTPRPTPAGADFILPLFRSPDGSIAGMCSAR